MQFYTFVQSQPNAHKNNVSWILHHLGGLHKNIKSEFYCINVRLHHYANSLVFW
jgi:hypothetical protein